MARYHSIGIQIDAPEELLEGPEEETPIQPAPIAPDAATADGLVASPPPGGGSLDG